MNFARFSSRTHNQGLNTFHVKPRRMIDCLGGKRSQFKAAIAIAGSNEVSYKVERHELQNEFNEVARNMDDMKLETANVFLATDHKGEEQTRIMSP